MTGTMPGIPLIALSQASTDHRQVCWQTAQMRTCAPRGLSRIAFSFDKLHIMCYLRNMDLTQGASGDAVFAGLERAGARLPAVFGFTGSRIVQVFRGGDVNAR